VQVSRLRADVAQFADIRDTLSFSADLLRDVTAQHIYDTRVQERSAGSATYEKRGRAASGAHDGRSLEHALRRGNVSLGESAQHSYSLYVFPVKQHMRHAAQGAARWGRSVRPPVPWRAASGLLRCSHSTLAHP
jgi:hypothetical protein